MRVKGVTVVNTPDSPKPLGTFPNFKQIFRKKQDDQFELIEKSTTWDEDEDSV